MVSDTNNSQMESFNRNAVRHREKVIRGFDKDDTAILAGLRLYHNHVRPHLGLPGNMAPGEAAGIHIEGLPQTNKWKTMIQAAAKSAVRPTLFVGPPMLQPIIWVNWIRPPHMTPGEAAGIHIEGLNK